MDNRPLLTKLKQRKQRLWTERASWDTHWRDLAEHVLPRTGRWASDNPNRGEKKHRLIYNSTATGALEILVAGMMAGATSPARPWMRLQTPDPDLNKYKPVEVWLETVTKSMLRVFNRSNTYRALPRYYQEIALYGTACGVVAAHPTNVIHHYPLTAGQYALAVDSEEEVNSMAREYAMTVSQMVEQFGLEKCSVAVQNSFNNGRFDEWRDVCHVIEPRFDRDETKIDSLNMPFRSVYFESGGKGSNGPTDVLLEEGYRDFPVLAPRWQTSGGDIYGSSPGMTALGDIRSLQVIARRKGQAVDFLVNPPTQGPASLKGNEIDKMPGGHTQVPGIQPITPIVQQTNFLGDLRELEQQHEDRIRSRFYADLFLMLASSSKSMTATEVAERHEEKLTMLGPTLERLHNELLSPLVSLTFGHMSDLGMLPPPPEELVDADLEPEFISMLAQAQQAVGASQDDRFQGVVQSMQQSYPDAMDVVDVDEYLRGYARKIGVDASILRAPDDVAEMRQLRKQAETVAAQSQMMQQNSVSAKNVAQAGSAIEEGGLNESPVDPFSGYGEV